MLHQVALVPHHLLAQAAQPLPTLQLVAGRLDEAVNIFYTREDWNKAEEEVSGLSKLKFQTFYMKIKSEPEPFIIS